MTTLHDFGSVLGRPLDTFFWALTTSWSRLSAHVRSGPEGSGNSYACVKCVNFEDIKSVGMTYMSRISKLEESGRVSLHNGVDFWSTIHLYAPKQ